MSSTPTNLGWAPSHGYAYRRLAPSRREPPSGSALAPRGLLIVACCAALLLTALPFATHGQASGLLALFGTLCFVAAALPLFVKGGFFVFSPPVFIALSVLLGATARAYYLIYSDSDRVAVLTDGLPVEDMLPGAIASVIALALLSLGYLSMRARLPLGQSRWLRDDAWTEKRVLWVAFLLAGIACIGIALFAAQAGISITGLADISKKRFVVLDDSAPDGAKAALGYVRALTSFANVAFLILVAWVATQSARWGRAKRMGYICLVGVAWVLAAAFPFISSTRTDILVLTIGGFVVYAALTRRVPWGKVIAAAAVLVVIAVIMAHLRAYTESGRETTSSGSGGGVMAQVADKLVGSGNFFPMDRSGVIVHRVPEYLDYMYGTSYLSVLFAPIPRTVWMEKPPVSLGQLVRAEIWRTWVHVGGYPPGFVGEALMNFGWYGVFTMPLILGAFIRIWYNSLQHDFSANKNAAVLYGATFWAFSQQMVELNFSIALANGLTAGVVTVICLLGLRGKRTV